MHSVIHKGKGIAPQAAYAFSAACVSQTGPLFSLGHSPSLYTDFGLQPYAALVCRLNGLNPRNPCKYMESYYFIDPGGMKG